jgi:O-antigen/teichoic acid export membrane protein
VASPLNNIARLAAGEFLAKTLSFLAFVYLARVLGVGSFGVLEFAGSVLTYFLLFADGGLEVWGIREAARSGDVPALVSRVVPLRLFLATLAFAVLLVLLPLFPDYPSLRLVLALFGLSLFAQAVSLKWVFMGQEKMSRVARGLVVSQIIFATAVFVFVRSPAALVWIPLLRLVGDLTMGMYFWQCFVRAYGNLRVPLTLRAAKQTLSPALTMGTSQAMALLNYNFDSVLLGFWRGSTTVGWYNAAYKPVVIALALPLSYFVGLFPALSRTYIGNRDAFRNLVNRSLELCWIFVVPLVIGGMLLAPQVIALLYGPAYASSVGPFRILVWSAALVILRQSYADSLTATGHQKLALRCAIVSASFNVGLNVLFIPRYGMLGAASATVSADVIWLVMAYSYFTREVLPQEPLPSLRAPVFAGIAMGAFLWLTQPLFWVARASIALLVYCAVLLLCGNTVVHSWLHLYKDPGH